MLESPSQAVSQGLGAAIPAIILVLVVVATSYYQTVQANRRNKNNGQAETKQGQQMQMVARIMPLFMGFISWGFPMGLVLYFAVSNLFRVGQQGSYWGIGTEIANYQLQDSLPCPRAKTAELAAIRTRLNRFNEEEQCELINWGYAVSDAAIRRYVDAAAAGPRDWPYPAYALDR